jgi:hypothetical protein
MLFPDSRVWTRTQKRLILFAGILGLVLFSTIVYTYERYYRGPNESALYGTWQMLAGDEDMYLQFNPDQTFSILALIMDEPILITDGRWYAGGPNIYLRFRPELLGQTRPTIWHIVGIAPNEFRVRVWRDGEIVSYKRVKLDSLHASNQALQPLSSLKLP